MPHNTKEKVNSWSREYRRRIRKEQPWKKHWWSIKTRCRPKGTYTKMGVKNYLTLPEIKFLWFLDEAYKMKKPSIDRKDGGDYFLLNCCFIEFNENISRHRLSSLAKPVNQYDLNGKFIKRWESGGAASRAVGVYPGNIHDCCHGRNQSIKGFIWRYAQNS